MSSFPAARAALALTAATMLAGCLSSGGPQTRRVDYICDGGRRVTVVFQPQTARIISPGQAPVEMQRRRTNNGFWFASATHSVRGNGRAMTLTEGFAAPVRCREVSSTR